ncbi:MAG: hypothetical protein ACI8YQ_002306 [Polaribacter sp.]|jgi:hypothetical protein
MRLLCLRLDMANPQKLVIALALLVGLFQTKLYLIELSVHSQKRPIPQQVITIQNHLISKLAKYDTK